MTREEAAPFLLMLFASGEAGLTPAGFAEACGLPLPKALVILEDLYRQRLLARVPNPKAKGYVCRTPKRGDEQAGFLFEPQGEPVVTVSKKGKKKRRGKTAGRAPDKISLF